MGRRGVRRRYLVATFVVGALVVTGLVVRHLWLTDTARVVDADEAVERFRSQSTLAPTTDVSTAASSTTVAALVAPPALGVYRYTTAGGEQIDVLGGTAHHYPAETTITVTSAGCGVQLRWDLLKERSEEYQLCSTADGMALAPVGAFYHEFFQHGSREEMVCDRALLIVPLAANPGGAAGQELACTLNDRPWSPVWKVLDRSVLSVAGVDVQTTHVRMTVTDDDGYWEHTEADWWFDDHGLPVKMTSTKESKSASDLVGDVVYREAYSAELVSFTPLQ